MSDLTYIFNWWMLFFILGISGLPLTGLIFPKLIDRGYGFSKTISLLLISFAVFLLSISKILPFSEFTVYLILIFYILVNILIFKKAKSRKDVLQGKDLFTISVQELLFISGLFLWSWVRGHQPDINGLEKFMDFGFINSILRADYLPAIDMWAAGQPINYYWFGHFVTAVATKLSMIPSYVTYNLMLGTILGFTLMGAFSICASLIKTVSKKVDLKSAIAGGLISAILLSFAGNFHTPYYVLKEGKDSYWYPDATRFIGYNPDVDDKTIHEFPIYSFVVSDLHPHLLNLPFVLLYLALLFVLIKEKGLFSKTIPLGFLLGIFFITNTWDFGNYLLATGFTSLFFNFHKYRFKIDTIYETAKEIGLIIIFSLITALPFILNFESIAEGIKFTHTKTPIWQLAILWGFPAVMSSIFLGKIIGTKLKKSDIFAISLIVASWVLIFLPEFFYVKDIYTASHYRANTMFKLTYQAYVMFYLLSGYVAFRVLNLTKRIYLKIPLAFLFSALFLSLLYYPKVATKSYYGDLKNYRGLNGEEWAKLSHPDSYEAIHWLRQNVKGQTVILEAPGDSYTEYNLISSYTGLPTISGWFVHEWLWRGSATFPQERVNEITQIYTSNDLNGTKSLLQKYDVEYVIIGPNEREKFPNINEAKFMEIGNIVFTSPSTKIYKLR